MLMSKSPSISLVTKSASFVIPVEIVWVTIGIKTNHIQTHNSKYIMPYVLIYNLKSLVEFS